MDGTLKAAIDAVEWTDAGRDYVKTWTDDAMPERRTVGFKAWMQSHDGDAVETLQLDLADKAGPKRPWAPGIRYLDSARRGSAAFFRTSKDEPNMGSWRYYAGVRVLASDARMMIAADDTSVMIYRVTAA